MGRLGVVHLCCGLGGHTRDGYHFLRFFGFVLVLLLIIISWLVHDSCCVCFLVCFLLSFSLHPLIRHYWCIKIVVFVLKNYSKSHVSNHFSVDFLEKGRVFWFESLLKEFTLFCKSPLDFYVKFIISACWLSILYRYMSQIIYYINTSSKI